NFVGVLTSVNCSASSATMIADQLRGMALDAFPNVDGVIALTHQSGCGLVPGSVGANTLVATLTIQDTGGIRATVRVGVDLIREMLPVLDTRRRVSAPISELVLGL